MLKFIYFALCVAFVAADIEAQPDFELPAGTITCQIDSENRDECIKEAIQDMLPKLVSGMESLRIPPIDPYYIPTYSMSFRRGDQLLVGGSVRNVNVYGGSKAKILDLKTKVTKTRIQSVMKVYFPESLVEGYYKGEGRFNGLKIKSKGFFNVSGAETNAVCRMEGDIITVDGVEYFNQTKFDFTPEFGKLKVYATGIFPDPELNRVTLDFVNQYWPFIVREMLPETKKRIEPIVLQEANKFFNHVPIRKMLYYGEDSE